MNSLGDSVSEEYKYNRRMGLVFGVVGRRRRETKEELVALQSPYIFKYFY